MDDNLKDLQFANQLYGMFRTVSTEPNWIPKNFLEQIAVYKNSTTFRLYWYDTSSNGWSYVDSTINSSLSPSTSPSPSVSPSKSPSVSPS